ETTHKGDFLGLFCPLGYCNGVCVFLTYCKMHRLLPSGKVKFLLSVRTNPSTLQAFFAVRLSSKSVLYATMLPPTFTICAVYSNKTGRGATARAVATSNFSRF